MDISQYKPKGIILQKHLLTLKDYSAADIFEVLHLAAFLKSRFRKGKSTPYLRGKTLAMIFAKSSTRTRVSFEQGIKQLGGSGLFLSSSDIQLGRGETIHDTAKTLSRYGIDGVMIRTFKQSDVEELAENGGFPVINGLTEVICRVIFSYVLTGIPFIGHWGIWGTTCITWLITALVSFIRYKRGHWKNKRLV